MVFILNYAQNIELSRNSLNRSQNLTEKHQVDINDPLPTAYCLLKLNKGGSKITGLPIAVKIFFQRGFFNNRHVLQGSLNEVGHI